MNKRKMTISRKGSALIIAMFFVILFSSFSVAMFTMSSNNMRIADNHQDANRAFEGAHSGLEFVRYWLGRVAMPGTTVPADRFAELVNDVSTDSGAAGLYASVSYDEDGIVPLSVAFNNISINTGLGQSFTATIAKTADLDVLQIDIAGTYGTMNRTIRTNYNFGTRSHNVFDFGVATRGPLTLLGNIALTGTNVSVEADVYIESLNNDQALSIGGHSQIAGDVTITNPDAEVDINGQAGIGGAMGYDDSMEHVDIGEAPVEFPVPNPEYFQQYVQNIYDPETTDTTFTNLFIPTGTNPTFGGGVTFNGIVYIEAGNVVTFAGHTTITGLIIGAGDMTDNSGENQINFQGTVVSNPVGDLPAGAEFDGLRDETGTFLMAPGFKASFGGNFDTLNGAIAANGIEFSGNAGGTIGGSVLNYSDEPMLLGGNGNLYFNRSGTTEVPAGFGPEIILHYNASTYTEAPTG